jgi:hypothetical protein
VAGFHMGPTSFVQLWRLALDESARSWDDRAACAPSAIISSKSRELSEYRRYQRTHKRMISASRVTPCEQVRRVHENNSSDGLDEKQSLPYHRLFCNTTEWGASSV